MGGTWSNEIDFIIEPVQIANMPYYTRDLRFQCVEFAPSPYFSDVINFDLPGSAYFDGSAVTNSEDIARQFTLPDRITIDTEQHGSGRLFFNEQASDFVPINAETFMDASGTQYGNDMLNKTNQQLKDDYNLCFAGAILPNDAAAVDGIVGGELSSEDILPMNFSVCSYAMDSFLTFETDQFENFDFFACWEGASSTVGGSVSAYNHPVCSEINNVWEISGEDMSIGMYPNPASGAFYLTDLPSNCTIEFMDTNGRRLQIMENVSENAAMNVREWQRGVFFIKVVDHQNGRSILGKMCGYSKR